MSTMSMSQEMKAQFAQVLVVKFLSEELRRVGDLGDFPHHGLRQPPGKNG